jgi:hypothetical protein
MGEPDCLSTDARRWADANGRKAAAPAAARSARSQGVARRSMPLAAINFNDGQGTQQNVGWQVVCRQGWFGRGRAGWTLATPDTITTGCACRTRSTDRASHRRRYEGSDGHAGR